MDAVLILKDRDKDVPNPMNREIRVSLTKPIDMDNIIHLNRNDDTEDI